MGDLGDCGRETYSGINNNGRAVNSYVLTAQDCRTLAAEIVLLVTVGVMTQQDPDRVIDDSAKTIQAFLRFRHINVSN